MLRVIARLNLGGPAHHVRILSDRLDPARFETLLVHGSVGPGEEEVDAFGSRPGAEVLRLPALSPALNPAADARALLALGRVARRFRPDIVHTHTAKAGMVGRLAAHAVRPRPVVVHTYHGHVLRGYFSPPVTAAYRTVERILAKGSDRLVGVGPRVVDELVELRVARRERFATIPLGLDLEQLLALEPGADGAARARLGIGADEFVAIFVGRLAAIKRVDLLLRAAAEVRRRGVPLRLLVIGDGALRPELERQAQGLGIGEAVEFLGYRKQLAPLFAAADVAVLTSDNEGTPVSLIEAAAAAVPAVAMDAGGVRDVVEPAGGTVVPYRDVTTLADELSRLAADPPLGARLGRSARRQSAKRYGAARLVRDVEELYEELLAARG